MNLSNSNLLAISIVALCMSLLISCQNKSGNYAIFENCSETEFVKEALKEYNFETFKFKAPTSWEFEESKSGEFINYQLINENEQSLIDNNIETFVITTSKVSEGYNFETEFEKFVSDQFLIEDQMIYGIETFEDKRFDNKAGIYLSGENQEIKMQFETLAICILKDESLYWLNSTSHSEIESDINICFGKEIISTFQTK